VKLCRDRRHFLLLISRIDDPPADVEELIPAGELGPIAVGHHQLEGRFAGACNPQALPKLGWSEEPNSGYDRGDQQDHDPTNDELASRPLLFLTGREGAEILVLLDPFQPPGRCRLGELGHFGFGGNREWLGRFGERLVLRIGATVRRILADLLGRRFANRIDLGKILVRRFDPLARAVL